MSTSHEFPSSYKSNVTDNISNTTVAPGAEAETTPELLSPEEAMQALRVLMLRIPLPSNEVAEIARRRRISQIDPRFVQAAIAAVGKAAGVPQMLGLSEEEVRQEVDVEGRWSAFADELRSFLRLMISANLVRRQRIGLLSLQTYQVCKQIVRDPGNEHLVAHVKEMQRLNKFGRVRRKTTPPTDQNPEPATSVTQ
jgi:hypothetical protein